MVERLTRVDVDTIDYRVTVTNPAAWTAPWTAAIPMSVMEETLFEYACHEGNYSLPLSGIAHWHGAVPDEDLTQVSVTFDRDDAATFEWLEAVTDEQYEGNSDR